MIIKPGGIEGGEIFGLGGTFGLWSDPVSGLVAMKNAFRGTLRIQPPHSPATAATTNTCTRPKYISPGGLVASPPPYAGPPAACPGVPPLAPAYSVDYDYYINGVFQNHVGPKTLTHSGGQFACYWTGFGVAVDLVGDPSWRISFLLIPGASSKKTTGGSPQGNFPDIAAPFFGMTFGFRNIVVA